MSAQDALELIDKKVARAEVGGMLLLDSSGVVELLGEVREALTSGPWWSEVIESNLRAELADEREQLHEERTDAELATVLYDAALRQVEGERDRARATAVRLEQELALEQTGISRRSW